MGPGRLLIPWRRSSRTSVFRILGRHTSAAWRDESPCQEAMNRQHSKGRTLSRCTRPARGSRTSRPAPPRWLPPCDGTTAKGSPQGSGSADRRRGRRRGCRDRATVRSGRTEHRRRFPATESGDHRRWRQHRQPRCLRGTQPSSGGHSVRALHPSPTTLWRQHHLQRGQPPGHTRVTPWRRPRTRGARATTGKPRRHPPPHRSGRSGVRRHAGLATPPTSRPTENRRRGERVGGAPGRIKLDRRTPPERLGRGPHGRRQRRSSSGDVQSWLLRHVDAQPPPMRSLPAQPKQRLATRCASSIDAPPHWPLRRATDATAGFRSWLGSAPPSDRLHLPTELDVSVSATSPNTSGTGGRPALARMAWVSGIDRAV